MEEEMKTLNKFEEVFDNLIYSKHLSEILLERASIKFEIFDMAEFLKKCHEHMAIKYGDESIKMPKVMRFKNCQFTEKVTFQSNEFRLTFEECRFNDTIWDNAVFSRKIRFHKCKFKNKLIMKNPTFEDLVDFYHVTFYETVMFKKVRFSGVTVFSNTSFMKSVFFSYTEFNDSLIIQSTRFDKGVDMSLSIIRKSISLFDIKIKRSKSNTDLLTGDKYLDEVSENDKIPIKNKRETYRLIKKNLVDQKNIIEANHYYYKENIAYWVELFHKFFSKNIDSSSSSFVFHRLRSYSNLIRKVFRFIYDKLSSLSNLFLLTLNLVSNRFKTSYPLGFIFTVFIAILFYSLSISNTSMYDFSWYPDFEHIPNLIKFIIPTHKIDYLGTDFFEKNELGNWFYIFDIGGRIFVGYGIYQTIQSFRKYG